MSDVWKEVTLAQAVDVLDYIRRPVSGAERAGRTGSVPYYGATGQVGWINDQLFCEKLVLLGEDGVDFLNPGVHKAYMINGPSWVNNHAHVLRAHEDVALSEYLCYWLNSAVDYSGFAAFGTRSKLTQSAMRTIPILLPPLAEQRRIVDLIAAVDAGIQASEREADANDKLRRSCSEELLHAREWPTNSLKNLAEPKGLIGGPFGSSLVSKDYADEGVPVIRGGNLSTGSMFIGGDFVFVSNDKAMKLRRNIAIPGDLIATQRGTIGQVAIVPPVPFNKYVISQSQMRLRADENVTNALFIYYALKSDSILHSLAEQTIATANPHINLGIFADLQIPVPPLAEQQSFVAVMQHLDGVYDAASNAAAALRSLRSALLGDLLSGDHEIPESYDELLSA